MIAQHVLGLGSNTARLIDTPQSIDIQPVSASDRTMSESNGGEASGVADEFPFGDLEYLGGWYNLGNIDPDLILATGTESEFTL